MSKFQRPPAGTDVDETHEVTLLPSPPSPCVSVRLGQGQVLLSKDQLEQMAEDAVPLKKRWDIDPRAVSDEERLSLINGRRARALLEAFSDRSDGSESMVDASELPGKTDYLLAHLLEEGAAAVVSLETGATIPTLTVRYTGSRAGPTAGFGYIMFSFDTGTERGVLQMINWWIS